VDLVVTCPKGLWAEWIAEGDCPGDTPTGIEWGFFLGRGPRPPVEAGERLYIVAWGRLRGYAPVTRVVQNEGGWAICREGAAVAVTIRAGIMGFRGWRAVWWDRFQEREFPDWRTAGVPVGAFCSPEADRR
jgi:hypothetical protein